ncbi:hypothetical protein [Natrinema halophilum]|uniref:hypothetical protein n=1 Tax=Natrinema halophilum TaxID=1699371 RepID=UPI001F42E54C|nr:hypothetical protein [Natrinema halophilum]UHQ96303.1 hypothetical protein HYG82_21840 [Natrinema halophilum]
MVAIRGYGTYIPVYRIERETIATQHGDYPSSGEVSVPASDEGIVSLGVNAASNALEHAAVEAADLDAVFAATMSDPFDERGVASNVGYAVGIDPQTRIADFEGSQRAAVDAILAGRDAIEADRAKTVLVVATDIRRATAGSSAEQTAGAGAAAVVLDADGDVASLDGAAVNTTGFVGRFTPAGGSPVEGKVPFNRDRFVEEVAEAIGEIGTADIAAIPAPGDDWGDRVLSALDSDAERPSTFADIGDAGTASVLLDLALVLENAAPDDRLLVAAGGPGGCAALALEVDDVTRATPMTTQDYIESKDYVTYSKHRSFREPTGGNA